ncbi:MAG: hypothetical protein ACM3SR_00600 [Ignavibacteriales bacterium]
MAATKETLKVKDFAETVKGITGLVKENYLNGMKLALSFWEEGLKVLDTQVDQLLNLQQFYIKTGKELYEKFPKEVKTFWNGNLQAINDEIDLLTAFQKDCVSSVRSVSDKFRKETLNLSQKNVEKAFSLFDAYLNLFR